MRRVAIAALLWAWPVTAQAHLVSTRFGELYSGLLHPLLALEHVVPWVALGLLGAQVGEKTSRWALLVFPVCVFAGVLFASLAPGWPIGLVGTLASFALLGGLIAANVTFSLTPFVVLVATLGVFQGYANGAEGLGGKDMLLYATGAGTAAYVIVTLMTAAGSLIAMRTQWGSMAIRVAGSWVLAIGVVFAGFTLASAG